MNEVQVLVTGLAWMGTGIRSIETTLEEMLQSAQGEILLTAYAVGNASERIMGKLESALERGVKVFLIANRLEMQPQSVVQVLQNLAVTYPHFYLYSFESGEEKADLHAKAIVVDRAKALVGSANLSWRGWTSNHELALLLIGPAASDVATALDRLRFSRFCRRIR